MIPITVQGTIAVKLAAGAPPPSSDYQHFRIYITANNGDPYTSIQEIELSETASGADFTSPGMTATESTFYTGSPGSNIINNNFTDHISNTWVSGTGESPPHWVAIDTAGAFTPVEIRIWCQSYSGGPARAPKDFEIQGSNDGTTWDTIKSFAGITGYVDGTPKTLSLV